MSTVDDKTRQRVNCLLGSHAAYAEGEGPAIESAIEDLIRVAAAEGLRIAPIRRDEALTQIQHVAYDGLVGDDAERIDRGGGTPAEAAMFAKLGRINNIAEGCEPDQDWRPLIEDADGDVIGGGDVGGRDREEGFTIHHSAGRRGEREFGFWLTIGGADYGPYACDETEAIRRAHHDAAAGDVRVAPPRRGR